MYNTEQAQRVGIACVDAPTPDACGSGCATVAGRWPVACGARARRPARRTADPAWPWP